MKNKIKLLSEMSVQEYFDKIRNRKSEINRGIDIFNEDLTEMLYDNELTKILEYCIAQWFEKKYPYGMKDQDKNEYMVINNYLKRRNFRCRDFQDIYESLYNLEDSIYFSFIKDYPDFEGFLKRYQKNKKYLEEIKEKYFRTVYSYTMNRPTGTYKQIEDILPSKKIINLAHINYENKIVSSSYELTCNGANGELMLSYSNDFLWDDEFYDTFCEYFRKAKSKIYKMFIEINRESYDLKQKILSTALSSNYLIKKI